MKHVLKGDRWTLDSAAVLLFAIGMAAEFQITSDSGEKHPDRILSAVGIALLGYMLAILLGMAVRKYVSVIRSWAWLSFAGAFIHTIILVATAIPHWLDHYRRFYSASAVTQSQYLLGYLPGMLGHFVVWAAAGAIFLIAVRWVDSCRKQIWR